MKEGALLETEDFLGKKITGGQTELEKEGQTDLGEQTDLKRGVNLLTKKEENLLKGTRVQGTDRDSIQKTEIGLNLGTEAYLLEA